MSTRKIALELERELFLEIAVSSANEIAYAANTTHRRERHICHT
jgi:hypothetical protein